MLIILLILAFCCFLWDAIRACLRADAAVSCIQLTPLGLALWALYHIIPLLGRLQ